jgi:hypothetical protein
MKMSEQSQQLKKQAVRLLSRNHRPLASSLKALPDSAFLSKQSSQLVEPAEQARAFAAIYSSAESALVNITHGRDVLLQSLYQAQALLHHAPTAGVSLSNLKQALFLAKRNDGEPAPDSLLNLAREIYRVAHREDLPLETKNHFITTALGTLKKANQDLYSFAESLTNKIEIIHENGVSVLKLPKELNYLDIDFIRFAKGIPSSQAILICVGDFNLGLVDVKFDAKLETLLNEQLSRTNAVIENNQLTFSDLEITPEIDGLLNMSFSNNANHPLKELAMQLSDILVPEPSIDINPGTIDDYLTTQIILKNDVRSTVELCQASIVLDPSQRWYVKNKDDTLTLTALMDVKSFGQNTELYAKPNSATPLKLNKLAMERASQYASQITIDPMGLAVGLQKTMRLPWHSEKLLYQQEEAQKHLGKRAGKGYIENAYSHDMLNKTYEYMGLNKKATIALLDHLLKSTGARTLVDIDVRHNHHQGGQPYYINLTLMSLQQDGIHARDASVIVHSPDHTPPSHVQLTELGLTENEFIAQAVTPEEAQKMLMKAINPAVIGRALPLIQNASHGFNKIEKTLPELHFALTHQAGLDYGDFIQQHQLSIRTDKTLTIDRNQDKGGRLRFSDTPAMKNGLNDMLKKGKGILTSLDGQASLLISKEHVALHDHLNGTRTNIGSTDQWRDNWIQKQKNMSSEDIPSDMTNCIRHQALLQAIANTSPSKDTILSTVISLPPTNHFVNLNINVWENIAQEYDFALSIEQNIERVKHLLPTGVRINDELAGGVGGKQGIEFLQQIYQLSPTLFAATVSGKNVAPKDILGDAAIKIDKSVATVTVRDWLAANMAQLQRVNPELTSHFGMAPRIMQALNVIPPSEKIPTLVVIDNLARSFSVPNELLKNTYQTLSAGGHTLFQSKGLPFSDYGVQRIGGLLSSVNRCMSQHSAVQAYQMHFLSRHVKQACKYSPKFYENETINTPELERRSLTLVTSNTGLSHSTKEAINAIVGAAVLQNSAYQISKHVPDEDPTIQLQAQDASDSIGISIIKRFGQSIPELEGLDIQVAPSEAILKQWLEKSLLYARGLSDKAPAFNGQIPIKTLAFLQEQGEHILHSHPALEQAETLEHFNNICDRAHQEVIATRLLQEYRVSMGNNVYIEGDRLPAERNYFIQAEKNNFTTAFVTKKDIITALITGTKNTGFPLKSLDELSAYCYQNIRPKDSLARAITYQMDKVFRQAPNSDSGVPWVNNLKAQITTTTRDPIALSEMYDEPHGDERFKIEKPDVNPLRQTQKPN